MTTVSFKAEPDLKRNLDALARRRGINTSAFIKLLLTERLNRALAEITENGLTVAEELTILASDTRDEEGPFRSAATVMRALRKRSHTPRKR